MSFLQSWALWALPLAGLPVLLHLLHQRRQRVVEWGAMMFLLQGARLHSGLRRLRQILLLLLRTLAVLGLVLALARPLTGGWLGGLGSGRPDTVVLLLDRSASMGELRGGRSKLEAGLRTISELLERLRPGRLLCIDDPDRPPLRVESAAELPNLPLARPNSTHADLPALFEAALVALRAEASGRAEIWVCSDGQAGDWSAEDPRWAALEAALLALPSAVRVRILRVGPGEQEDFAVWVERAQRREQEERAELVLDVTVEARGPVEAGRRFPVAIEIGGARSVVEVELSGNRGQIRGHRLALESEAGESFGFAELGADANPENNRYFFVFGAGAAAEVLVVSDDPAAREVLRIAAEAAEFEGMRTKAIALSSAEAADFDPSDTALVLWHAPLPEGAIAEGLMALVERGGGLVCLAVDGGAGREFAGIGFQALEVALGPDGPGSPAVPSSWRRDTDLLRDGEDGRALPVDGLEIQRFAPVVGDVTALARLPEGQVLLGRAPTSAGGLYFFGTGPTSGDSNASTQGVLLVAIAQRALEGALASLATGAQRDAGSFDASEEGLSWLSDGREEWLLSERSEHAGVLQSAGELVALNRPRSEDQVALLAAERIPALMPGVPIELVENRGQDNGPAEEVWRACLLVLLAAVLAEALLCITESSPPKTAPAAASNPLGAGGLTA